MSASLLRISISKGFPSPLRSTLSAPSFQPASASSVACPLEVLPERRRARVGAGVLVGRAEYRRRQLLPERVENCELARRGQSLRARIPSW